MKTKVLESVARYSIPLDGREIIVAVSGGSDSMALLHYFSVHAAHWGITLCAVHCEHGIRGEASLEDARFVRDVCGAWGIELYSFSADCPSLAAARKVSLETAARQFRYGCFDRILREKKADLVATAHHCGDNAETVLFNIARGASLTGAGGISDREGYVKLVSQNPHHADKEVEMKRIRAIALVKASIRMNSIR